MKKQALIGISLLCSSHLFSTPIFAADWTKTNQQLIDQQIIPSYQKLSASSAQLAQLSQQFCQSPNQAGLQSLQQQWKQVMADWTQAQPVRFGPADSFLRHYRIEMWPDKRNTGGRQFNKMIAKADPALLETKKFSRSSVALQGLTASERLLFGKKSQASLFGGSDKNQFRCNLQLAIASNLQGITSKIKDEWQTGEQSYRALLLSTGQKGNDFFSSDSEITARFLNNLYTQLQSIVDQKLLAPLGSSLEKAKGKKSESWRSKNSLENIKNNLLATQQWYLIAFAPELKGQALDGDIKAAFTTALLSVDAIKLPLVQAVADATQRAKVQTLVKNTSSLKNLIGSKLPSAINLPLGFNSLDGD
ncbi:imelysin family protein [Pelagibaculum spongiae]|uniref:Imelysin-like domain-containing protein n=1 Tax=Pelagibaculum spongiae TaxID=2080658 RepID=A0A2V1GYW5_9GAMM|nr:imelysin family protein [Pelagibaculum spongiae]PVZ72244.1 hypothetical protein DC094_04315 [Pelagibaculum spongiae]